MTSVTSNDPRTAHRAVVLDWRSAHHWALGGPQPCRYCNRPTRLRLDLGHNTPHMHKVCAEKFLSEHPDRIGEFPCAPSS